MAVTHVVACGNVWAESLCSGIVVARLNVAFECGALGRVVCGSGGAAMRGSGAVGRRGLARCVSGSAGGSVSE